MQASKVKPGEVYDFYFGMKSEDERGVMHGVVRSVNIKDGTVTVRSTTSDAVLEVPAADVIEVSGPGWFALAEQVREEHVATAQALLDDPDVPNFVVQEAFGSVLTEKQRQQIADAKNVGLQGSPEEGSV